MLKKNWYIYCLCYSFKHVIDYEIDRWDEKHFYCDLSLPENNSVSLAWVCRDGNVVNLPSNLLVEGDVILIGPSRKAPAICKQVCFFFSFNDSKFFKTLIILLLIICIYYDMCRENYVCVTFLLILKFYIWKTFFLNFAKD